MGDAGVVSALTCHITQVSLCRVVQVCTGFKEWLCGLITTYNVIGLTDAQTMKAICTALIGNEMLN